MAKKKPARRPSPLPRRELARLRDALAQCSDRIDALEHTVDVNIKRMAEMQADIDHLRLRR